MNLSDFFNKNSNNPLKPFQGVLAFVLITASFIVFSFYFNSPAVTGGQHGISTGLNFSSPLQPSGKTSPEPVAEMDSSERPGFLEEGGAGCDISDGNWVWDDAYPLYQSRDCLFIEDGSRCSENGRPDNAYTKWRWQPKNCNLPRFDSRIMLEKLRNRRLLFVGDSIGWNQWESLLCMLASGVSNKSSIYEVNGNVVKRTHRMFMSFIFKDYNCSIEVHWAPYLVSKGRPPPNAPKEVRTTLKVDRLVPTSRYWSDADVLIFNVGHWWDYWKTIGKGCYFQENGEVKMNMSIETAFRRAVETLASWIDNQVNTSKTQVLFRTFSPQHFRNGDWNSGGTCHLEKLPNLGPYHPSDTYEFEIPVDVLSKHKAEGMELDILNVTAMTSGRKDGHISIYKTRRAPLNQQDCSHWCMPGVPDSWNELLYAVFLRRETSRDRSRDQVGV